MHVYGRVSLINDPEALRELVNRMSRHFEGGGENAWVPTYPDKMLEAITGFVMEVDEVQAKYKLSQNRSPADQQGVIRALLEGVTENEHNVASLMQGISCTPFTADMLVSIGH